MQLNFSNCTVSVPDFCSCNADDGYAPATVKVNAPDGQNWTVKEVIGLYLGTGPYSPVQTGTALTPMTGADMHLLAAHRAIDKGYRIVVTNGFSDLEIQVGNPAW